LKKNVIGHMEAPKKREGSWIRRWQIIPRLICLLLAFLIWLMVVQSVDSPKEVSNSNVSVGKIV